MLLYDSWIHIYLIKIICHDNRNEQHEIQHETDGFKKSLSLIYQTPNSVANVKLDLLNKFQL